MESILHKYAFLMLMVLGRKMRKAFFLLLPVVTLPMNICASTHGLLPAEWSPKTL